MGQRVNYAIVPRVREISGKVDMRDYIDNLKKICYNIYRKIGKGYELW